jgi:hypothetical protein
MNNELWQSAILPMIVGLAVIAGYIGWLFYFYRVYEPGLRKFLSKIFQLELNLTYLGYECQAGKPWLQRFSSSMFANILLVLHLILPFFVPLMVWGWFFTGK